MDEQHSGLGIASLIISILAGMGLVAVIAVIGYLEVTTPNGINEESPLVIGLGLSILGLLLLDFLAAILGFVGLFQPDRKKLLAVLGLFLSSGTIVAYIGLAILGSLIE